MTRSPIRALRSAVYARVHTDYPSRKVFVTMPPLEEVPPFVIVSSATTADWSVKDMAGFRVTMTVEAWDRSMSDAVVLTMVDEVLSATQRVDIDLAADDFQVWEVAVDSIDVRSDIGDALGIYQHATIMLTFGVIDNRENA